VWKLVGPLVSVHRLVLFFSNVYRFPNPPIHSVAFSAPAATAVVYLQPPWDVNVDSQSTYTVGKRPIAYDDITQSTHAFRPSTVVDLQTEGTRPLVVGFEGPARNLTRASTT